MGPFLEEPREPRQLKPQEERAQSKGRRAIKRGPVSVTGPRVPLPGHRFHLQAFGSPCGGPLNCLIVGHTAGFNCIGPRGASKGIGLGHT